MTTLGRRIAGLMLMPAAAGVGLASRFTALRDWPLIGEYGGDAAWTVAACGGLRMLRPEWSARRVAMVGYGVSVAVEVSQLVRAPWIDAIRTHPVGGLLLGRGFLWTDLVAYAGGAVMYAILDRVLLRRSDADPRMSRN